MRREAELANDPTFTPENEEQDSDDDDDDDDNRYEEVEEEEVLASGTVSKAQKQLSRALSSTVPVRRKIIIKSRANASRLISVNPKKEKAQSKTEKKKKTAKKRRASAMGATSVTTKRRNLTPTIVRERQVAKHDRTTARGIKTMIFKTFAPERANQMTTDAWLASAGVSSTTWKNWSEEMFNATVHVICQYFARYQDKIEDGTTDASFVFGEARFALEAFGSYDGQQPHTQLNFEIFEFVVNHIVSWVTEQFQGNFKAFSRFILDLFISGGIPNDAQVAMLRQTCRKSIAEPRTYVLALRASHANPKKRLLSLEKRKKKPKEEDNKKFEYVRDPIETDTTTLEGAFIARWDRVESRSSTTTVAVAEEENGRADRADPCATASTTDCSRTKDQPTASAVLQTVSALDDKSTLLDDLAKMEQ